jgi:predicted RNase H-like HicB family nuclease
MSPVGNGYEGQGELLSVRSFDVLIEKDEDGWLVGSVIQLPGCHTQARSLDELMSNVKEAIQAYLGDGGETSGSEFLGVQRVEVEG